jgi:predicted aspartyl protease
VDDSGPSILADGREVPVDAGETSIRLEGRQFHTPVFFAGEGEPAMLGVVTLKQARLTVDPL